MISAPAASAHWDFASGFSEIVVFTVAVSS